MTTAQANPVKRQYTRREVSTSDMPLGQKADIDLGDLVNFIRNESYQDLGEKPLLPEYMDALAFNEEPVTISIEENARADFPETYVPVQVNGRGAEIFANGQWITVGWLPIGILITTKRKYLEILIRSKPDNVRTEHESGDSGVATPQNKVKRRTSSAYPVTIIEDKNPRGFEWASRIRAEY